MKRWSLIATVAGALLCLGPVAAPSPVQASQPTSVGCVADAELKVGDTGSSVICLQYALGMIGLSDQPITGVYDEATSSIVRWFQSTNPPLRADGRAGAQTLTELGIWSGKTLGAFGTAPTVQCEADATIRPGDVSAGARCLQESLRDVGLYDGEITGVSDGATVDALKQFQAATPPLEVDGWAGPRTLAALGIWSGRTSTLVTINGTVTFSTTPPNASAPGSTGPGSVASTSAPAGPWPSPMHADPNWRVTADGIPVYGNRTPCTRAQADVIAFEFAKDGADIDTQQWAVYVASREGGCRFDAVNQNAATQDDSHCTFQLNALAGMFGPTAELGRHGWTAENVKASLDNCANAASDLWVYCGRGPWTPPYSCRPPWKDMATPPAVIVPPPSGDTSDGGD